MKNFIFLLLLNFIFLPLFVFSSYNEENNFFYNNIQQNQPYPNQAIYNQSSVINRQPVQNYTNQYEYIQPSFIAPTQSFKPQERAKYLLVYEMQKTETHITGIEHIEVTLPDGRKGSTIEWEQGYKLPFYELPLKKELLYIELSKNDEDPEVIVDLLSCYSRGHKQLYWRNDCKNIHVVLEFKNPLIDPNFPEIGIHSSVSTGGDPERMRISKTQELKELTFSKLTAAHLMTVVHK